MSLLPWLDKESELHKDSEQKEHHSLDRHAHQVTSRQQPFKRITDLVIFTYKKKNKTFDLACVQPSSISYFP